MKKAIALAVLALAACNKGSDVKVENATPEEVAAKVQQSAAADQSQIEPGQWSVASEMKLVELKGVPGAVADQMKASMEHKSTDLQCITPEEVKKPEVFAGKQDSGCKYERFEMGGGKINAVMHCPASEGGGKMTMTMNGTYSPRDYTVDATMDMSGAGDGQGMKMAMHATAKRVGDCPAGAAADK